MRKIIIHIGYAKTYTTSLQSDVFPNLDLLYLGKFYMFGRQFFGATSRLLMNKKIFWKAIKLYSQISSKNIVLISAEKFLSFPNFIGPGISNKSNLKDFENHFKIQLQLFQMIKKWGGFDEIILIITNRDYQSHLNSVYKHQLKHNRLTNSHGNMKSEWLKMIDDKLIEKYFQIPFIDSLIPKDNFRYEVINSQLLFKLNNLELTKFCDILGQNLENTELIISKARHLNKSK